MHNIARMVGRLRLVTLDMLLVKKRWRGNQSTVQREMALLAARSCSEAFAMLRICTARRMVFAHVTFYGVVDNAFTYLGNQRNLGSEDIGGGTKAILRLDSGFKSLTDSQNSAGFLCTRQVYIGLSNDRYGKFTLGRQTTPYFRLVGALGAADVHACDVYSPDSTLRFNSSVTYLSLNVAGARFSAMGVVGDSAEYDPVVGAFAICQECGVKARVFKSDLEGALINGGPANGTGCVSTPSDVAGCRSESC